MMGNILRVEKGPLKVIVDSEHCRIALHYRCFMDGYLLFFLGFCCTKITSEPRSSLTSEASQALVLSTPSNVSLLLSN